MAGATYEIRVVGAVPPELMSELRPVTVVGQESRTVLRGRFADQAALQGFLRRLSALGLELVELRAVPGSESGPPEDVP